MCRHLCSCYTPAFLFGVHLPCTSAGPRKAAVWPFTRAKKGHFLPDVLLPPPPGTCSLLRGTRHHGCLHWLRTWVDRQLCTSPQLTHGGGGLGTNPQKPPAKSGAWSSCSSPLPAMGQEAPVGSPEREAGLCTPTAACYPMPHWGLCSLEGTAFLELCKMMVSTPRVSTL